MLFLFFLRLVELFSLRVKERESNNIEWVEAGQKADDKEAAASVDAQPFFLGLNRVKKLDIEMNSREFFFIYLFPPEEIRKGYPISRSVCPFDTAPCSFRFFFPR